MSTLKSTLKSYPTHDGDIDTQFDADSSIGKILSLVERNTTVLDVGCATGYIGRALSKIGCRVTGIEMNPRAAEQARKSYAEIHVGDLDAIELRELLPSGTFDTIIFGDVLEHLRDPIRILRDARYLLREGGYVIASVPNIAHAAIRLALLDGQFRYTEQGILDDSHLRFFTLASVQSMFAECGYEITSIERTKLPLFGESDLIPKIDPANYPAEVISKIQEDEDADTLQFVLTARPVEFERVRRRMAAELESAQDEVAALQRKALQLEDQHRQALEAIADRDSQISTLQSQHTERLAEMEGRIAAADSAKRRSDVTIQATSLQFIKLRAEIEQQRSQARDWEERLLEVRSDLQAELRNHEDARTQREVLMTRALQRSRERADAADETIAHLRSTVAEAMESLVLRDRSMIDYIKEHEHTVRQFSADAERAALQYAADTERAAETIRGLSEFRDDILASKFWKIKIILRKILGRST